MPIPVPNAKAVDEFISQISDPVRKADCETLVPIIQEITGQEPALWGNIIGFGAFHYKYESGHEGDTMIIGVAPRKAALTLYGVIFYDEGRSALTDLGPHEAGKGCLYIKNLQQINMDVLKTMIRNAYKGKMMK